MLQELTTRQATILNFVERYTAMHGFPPTVREIAKHHGMKSPNGVKKHLDALTRKGHLTRKSGARALQCAQSTPRHESVSVPIIGRVAAGQPILAEEHRLGEVTLDRSLVRWNQPFLLKVKGDSMINAGILEGDYVLVNAQAQAQPGDIVVALLDDDATVKRFLQTPDGYVLQPENPNYAPIPLRPDGPTARIVGKVNGVLRLPHLN
ncbi:MAG: transcriptional repressor LexA [Nitrospirae bacterium]|nr:transcriptional repressor LexA [Nitrospirota bacterium]